MTIFDQNKSISEASSVKFLLEEDKIKVLFSNNFPSSIRVNGLGRRDHYPFFIPVIDLFNSLQNLNLQGTILGTGCYENIKLGNTLSIAGDGGNAWGYFGPAYKKLAPSLNLYEYWRDNPDALSDEDLINYYIENYFNHRLKDLDSFELLKTLNQGFGRDIILLCHEKMSMDLSKGSFCHRALVADYIELKSGIIIPEISIDEKGNIEEIKRLSYKPKLSELINGKLVL